MSSDPIRPPAGRQVKLAALVFTIVLTVLAPGCTVGPDYHRPPPLGTNATPTSYLEAPPSTGTVWKAVHPIANVARGEWWKLFGDAELERLETTATANSPQLAAALARYDQTRALIAVAESQWFPQVDAVPSISRQRTSANQPENGHSAGVGRTYNTFTLPVQAGWELDLWGRVRRQVESAKAQASASEDNLDAARLALQGDVATLYFALRSLDREYDVVDQTIDTFRRSLELTVNRKKGGIATDLDVSQAESQLRTTEAELPALRLQRARLLHALAALCGQPAAGFDLSKDNHQEIADPIVPSGLPSELLERRPDVIAAEEKMAAANAQIGVAQAAFYPSVRIDGLAGLQSVSASSLLNWPSRFWAVGPTLDLPIFTGGRNRAQLAYSKAVYEETVAAYRQTVLGAFQEVEDQLAATHHLDSQLAAETSALEAARRTLAIANNRYKAGLVTYLEVATAQSSALTLERRVVQLRNEKLGAKVGLIKALGGGWQSATLN